MLCTRSHICTIVYLDTLIIISGTHLAPVPPVNLKSCSPISIQFRCVSLSRCESLRLPTYSQSRIDHSLGECPHTHCRWVRPPNLMLMQILVNGVWTVGNQRWIRIKKASLLIICNLSWSQRWQEEEEGKTRQASCFTGEDSSNPTQANFSGLQNLSGTLIEIIIGFYMIKLTLHWGPHILSL